MKPALKPRPAPQPPPEPIAVHATPVRVDDDVFREALRAALLKLLGRE